MSRYHIFSLDPREEWTWPTEGWKPEAHEDWRKRKCVTPCTLQADYLILEISMETGDPWPFTLCLPHLLYMLSHAYIYERRAPPPTSAVEGQGEILEEPGSTPVGGDPNDP